MIMLKNKYHLWSKVIIMLMFWKERISIYLFDSSLTAGHQMPWADIIVSPVPFTYSQNIISCSIVQGDTLKFSSLRFVWSFLNWKIKESHKLTDACTSMFLFKRLWPKHVYFRNYFEISATISCQMRKCFSWLDALFNASMCNIDKYKIKHYIYLLFIYFSI